MKADTRFLGQPQHFWASVRLLSQWAGYTDKATRKLKAPTQEEVESIWKKRELDATYLSQHASELTEYFEFRAHVLNQLASKLMCIDCARRTYERLREQYKSERSVPMNKQRGTKKTPAYLTGIVNLLVETNARGQKWDSDPKELATVVHEGKPVWTMSRRIDGAFPSSVNPIAIWEIKEYYHTTTFGSRVADAVYESLLDGLEIKMLSKVSKHRIKHYLIIDGYRTWWEQGKSYLCRLIDMLHMGYVDEVLFGYEVVERLPQVVAEWVSLMKPSS